MLGQWRVARDPWPRDKAAGPRGKGRTRDLQLVHAGADSRRSSDVTTGPVTRLEVPGQKQRRGIRQEKYREIARGPLHRSDVDGRWRRTFDRDWSFTAGLYPLMPTKIRKRQDNMRKDWEEGGFKSSGQGAFHHIRSGPQEGIIRERLETLQKRAGRGQRNVSCLLSPVCWNLDNVHVEGHLFIWGRLAGAGNSCRHGVLRIARLR
ncbi:hypothetical protein BDP81DRAFT_136943 [Colletotrichum phormii]|uniref:Uncharacterized protein n=1 Tax=Colletotrichum phormii TaxID=359342 RepID=A0AAI9ZEU2_9PEZI|nr:uncharacterized protein BDP81DRAFT_136943 [Colletotrichum phormii]KAK1623247.1 hypothetical protein BDP81DRAFT_136943 [Colletotrichum phormii]